MQQIVCDYRQEEEEDAEAVPEEYLVQGQMEEDPGIAACMRPIDTPGHGIRYV